MTKTAGNRFGATKETDDHECKNVGRHCRHRGCLGGDLWSVRRARLAWLARGRGLDEATVLRRQNNLEIGVRYHMYHALALLAVGWLQSQTPSRLIGAAGGCWLVGILLFSGCLYAYALTGLRGLAMIVPIGGVALIVGWLALALGAAIHTVGWAQLATCRVGPACASAAQAHHGPDHVGSDDMRIGGQAACRVGPARAASAGPPWPLPRGLR